MTIFFRAIRSRRKFNKYPQIKRDLSKSLDSEVKPAAIAAYQSRVDRWKPENQPTFKAQKIVRPDSISVRIIVTGNTKVWNILTRGARGPWFVAPVNAQAMSIIIGHQIAGFSKGHTHPGIEKKIDTQEIIREFDPEFRRLVENAWRRAIRTL